VAHLKLYSSHQSSRLLPNCLILVRQQAQHRNVAKACSAVVTSASGHARAGRDKIRFFLNSLLCCVIDLRDLPHNTPRPQNVV
jgi:hypothetical protein